MPALVIARIRGGRVDRATVAGASLVMLLAAGCGDGRVVANGRVVIEGQPATGGRLSLLPVIGGQRAFSAVTEDGAFALRSTGGELGAFPGSYRVSFKQPANEQAVAGLPRELSADELSVSYQSPRDSPLVIPEAGAEDLLIEIRQDRGWSRNLIE